MDRPAADSSGKFSDADERIFALLAIVEDQQTAVRAGIQGMAQERAALATERVALVQQAEQLKRLTDKLVGVIGAAIPQMAQSAGDASREAFRKMLVAAGQEVSGAVARSAKPELDKFAAAIDLASAVQLQLDMAVKDFRRKWAWVVAFAMAGLVLAAALVAYGTVWWQGREFEQLQSKRDQLSAEVKTLQGQAALADQAKRNNGRKPGK